MKNKLSHLSISIGLTLLVFSFSSWANDNLKAFPAAQEGMVRYVIQLPHKERGEEDDYKVEFVVGKEVLTDSVNKYSLGNIIKPFSLKGWGFTYYGIADSVQLMSTMMAPPTNTPKTKKMVSSQPITIRYNSRVPVVIYLPEEYKVQYRIWRADKERKLAQKG